MLFKAIIREFHAFSRIGDVSILLLFAAATAITVDEINNREYPWSIKMAQVFVTGGIVLFFFAVLYWSALGWAAFLSLFGSYRVRSSPLSAVYLPYLLYSLPIPDLTMYQTSF